MNAKRFQTKKEANNHTEIAKSKGLQFNTHKFAGKRKFQFFSGGWWDWMTAIS